MSEIRSDGPSDNSDVGENVDLLSVLNTKGWIGLSWGVDWIAFRGTSVDALTVEEYESLHGQAATELIDRLARLEAERDGIKFVKGVWEDDTGSPDTYATEPVWSNASLDLDDFDLGRYVLDLAGCHDGLGETGALMGKQRSWVRISIASEFILENWPPVIAGAPLDRNAPSTSSRPNPPSEVEANRVLDKIIRSCPPELKPLNHEQVAILMRLLLPGMTVRRARALYGERHKAKRGHRAGQARIVGREEIFEELCRKMTSSQCQNWTS